MADKEKVVEALEALDPTNDDHWTTEGLPRLDVLKGMVGDTITRAEVNSVAPKFNRDYPVTEAPDEVGRDEVDAGDTSAEGQTPPTDGPSDAAGAQGQGDEPDGDEEVATDGYSREAFDNQIRSLTEHISETEQKLAEGNRYLAGLRDRLTDLYRERDQAFPPKSQAAAIQEFLRSQHLQRAARVLGHAKAMEAVGGGVPAPKSPLDQALGSRRGGRGRPTFG